MRTTHAGALMPHIPETDPFFANVVLLLHPDDPLVDRSSYSQVLNNSGITLVPEVFLGNDVVMNNASNAGTNSLAVAATTSFNRAANEPFTIEFSMRVNSITVGQGTYLMSWADGGHYFAIAPDGAGATYQLTLVDPAGATFGPGYLPGTWYQFTLAYDGSRSRAFADGVLVATSNPANSDAITGPQSYDVFRLVDSAGTRSTIADITEVRVTIGVARYTTNYTPRTVPFPNQ